VAVAPAAAVVRSTSRRDKERRISIGGLLLRAIAGAARERARIPGYRNAHATAAGVLAAADDLPNRRVRPVTRTGPTHKELPVESRENGRMPADRGVSAASRRGRVAKLKIYAGPTALLRN
jgi:hypothetical protein